MSVSTPASVDNENVRKVLIALTSGLGLEKDHLVRVSIGDTLKKVFDCIMALDGQAFVVEALNNKLVPILYSMMPHPSTDLVGNQPPPDLVGQPNMPYARSVQTGPKHNLPDAATVFTRLLERSKTEDTDSLVKHSGGLSSLTFAFGTLVIHSVFNSEHSTVNNKTLSYFTLSPMLTMRLKEGQVRGAAQGRGVLHPDAFVDARVLFLPPVAAALLVLFNRNHNYIAKVLLEQNERGTWSNPPPTDAAARPKQDKEVFDTARLVNCQHFVNIVITDYVGGIMDMVANGGGWPGNAQVLGEIVVDDKKVSRGEENLVSVEFNVLYRWHATLSKLDIKWIEDALSKATGSKDWTHMGPADYERGRKKVGLHELIKDPENATAWGLNDVERDPDNRAFGGHIHKILTRLLPAFYPDSSIYMWFPMSTPTFMKSNKKLPEDPGEPWSFRPNASL